MNNEALRAEIIAVLAQREQKASYAALSGLVGWNARTVMSTLAKTTNNRWIVNAGGSHRPYGYPDALMPDEFVKITNTLETPESLRDWLAGQEQLDGCSEIAKLLDN